MPYEESSVEPSRVWGCTATKDSDYVSCKMEDSDCVETRLARRRPLTRNEGVQRRGTIEMVSTRIAVTKWISKYSRAWRSKDAKEAVTLFTEKVEYHSHPFRPAQVGRDKVREYTLGAFDIDEVYDVRFGKPIVDGSRAAVEYWGSMKENGKDVTIAGFVMLGFARNGLCNNLRDYWILQEGRLPIPKWAR